MKIPTFATKEELFSFLKTNKSELIAEKKYQVKHGDCIAYHVSDESGEKPINKAIANPSEYKGNELKVSLVINTTNVMDSHSDVHFPSIWNKSLKENKNIYLLEEHKMTFRNIISDDVKAIVKDFNWIDLGINSFGKTQALVFNATIKRERNEYMFEQYLKGHVKNHSVGMRYIKIELALNSEDKYDQEEKAVWDKYISQIVNRAQVEEQGYFWAVTEAKVIEGSAVVVGSNTITPTLSVEEKTEAASSTSSTIEPPIEGTQKQVKINYEYLLNNLKK